MGSFLLLVACVFLRLNNEVRERVETAVESLGFRVTVRQGEREGEGKVYKTCMKKCMCV